MSDLCSLSMRRLPSFTAAAGVGLRTPVIPTRTSPSPKAPQQIYSDYFQALFARAMKFSVAKTELLLSDLE